MATQFNAPMDSYYGGASTARIAETQMAQVPNALVALDEALKELDARLGRLAERLVPVCAPMRGEAPSDRPMVKGHDVPLAGEIDIRCGRVLAMIEMVVNLTDRLGL